MTVLTRTFQKTALVVAMGAVTCAAQANLVTSIKPLGFIASAIAEGVTDVEVIVPPGASPHDYHLKPSDVQKVKSADLMLWIGEDVDSFLEKSVESVERKKVITIADLADVEPLLGKSDHDHEHDHNHAHDHDHKHEHDHKHDHQDEHKHEHHEHKDAHNHDHHHHAHDDLSVNWHVWYSPQISKIVAQKIADKLTLQYPDKKDLIAQNVADFDRTLATQSEKIKAQLAPLANKGFYVFHDAYGYFNDAYGLKQTGYFTINPLVAPGAKTLATIKQEIAEHKVSCLFAEPQFTPKVIESLSKGTGVHVGRLDPMGDKVALGKNAYADFLQFTADSYAECLSK